MRLGVELKGIMGAVFVSSMPFLVPHWSGENKLRYKVMIDLVVLLNSEKEALLSLDLLNQGSLENYNWTPRSSGIEISNRYLNELEALWTDFLMTKDTR